MHDFPSPHRPLASQPGLQPHERRAVRRATAIALAGFVLVFATIATLVVVSPTPSEMFAVLGP